MDESSEDPEPVSYFTDVVEEGNRFGILRGPHPGKFFALSNFRMDLNCEVKSGSLSSLSSKRVVTGYLCTVTWHDGEVLG